MSVATPCQILAQNIVTISITKIKLLGFHWARIVFLLLVLKKKILDKD